MSLAANKLGKLIGRLLFATLVEDRVAHGCSLTHQVNARFAQ
jgi:hypothetical protein